MDRDIVVIVQSDQEAYEAIKALSQLSLEGSIELYSSAVIKKAKGEVLVVRDNGPDGPLGTLLGASLGALTGLLAGPAGAAAGAAIGGAAGLTTDVVYSGIGGDFVRQVAGRLNEGTYAVIASVWEDWAVPIDTAMAPFGGVVIRQTTDEIAAAHIKAEMNALKEEQAHVRAEVKKATGEVKAGIDADLKELEAKQKERQERLKAKAHALEERWQAQVAAIRQGAESAKVEAKRRHELHLAKLSRFAELQGESFRALFSGGEAR